MFAMIVAAFIIGIAVAVPPGPVTISGSQRAITTGFWSAFNFYVGSIVADTLYAVLAYLIAYGGLSTLDTENNTFRLALWILGGAWLIYMGIDAIRTRIDMETMRDEAGRSSRWRVFRSGLLVTLFNPLTIISWMALAGSFFASWNGDWPPVGTVGLIAVFAMLGGAMAWVLSLALLLSAVRRMISPRILKWVSVASGLFLIVYGLSAWWSALDMLV